MFYVDSLSTFVTTVFFLTNEKQSLGLNILLLTQSFLPCVLYFFLLASCVLTFVLFRLLYFFPICLI